MFEEKLEEMRKEVYQKDDKKKIIKAVMIVVFALAIITIFFLIKSKFDYSSNSEKLEKYAKDYYEKNMRSVNVASGYTVTLKMLKASDEYDLDYFDECNDKKTNVDIIVDRNGDITKTKVNINCK